MPLPPAFDGRLALPAIAAPMFLVSGPDLVVETCRAGLIGTFPSLNQRSTEGYIDWLDEIEGRLAEAPQAAPYGVNLIVQRSNKRLDADLKVTVERKVPLVITSLGAVPEVVEAVQSYGGLVFHDVISRRHAEKAAEAGVDGLIAVCAGAGGHAGTLSPFAFLPEIRRFFGGTIVLSGAINDGSQIAAARMLGADLAYLGTRFIATRESRADEAYKRMILEAGTKDIVYTPAVSGIPANFLRASLESAGLDPGDLKADKKLSLDHSKAWRDVWSAGQGAATIEDIPDVAALCARLKQEHADAIQRFCA
ncbi:NAD(P)H-dependent flavin oxidoreductase [Aquibaculum sediminis]|uniref:NAD(P)H-dependent flavin oxidoreductase n=1 Tax=Aquibaculum sediminis TaxID=3231907 RepID=UPI0034554AEF